MTYLAPGVFIEEVPSGPQPIAAAPTSVVAIVGTTERGPYMEPTRVTGWGQYVELFGGTDSRGFTAESAFGFFDNGGPAAYIVRVDPSVSAEWIVNDRNGNEAFRVEASSAGSWANDLQVNVAPDATGGSGLLYSGRVTNAVTVTGNAVTNVQVESTAGISAGDVVMVVPAAGAAAEATVDSVASATTLAVNKSTAGNVALAVGDRIAGLGNGGDTTLRLAAANGIKQGDLVIAELPDRSRVTATVTSAVNEGAGMVLTLAAGLGSDIPGAQFAARVDRFQGTIGTLTNPRFSLSDVTWHDEPAVRPVVADIPTANFRAFAANGLTGNWSTGNTRFEFPAVPQAGAVEVEATLSVRRYADTVALSNPTLDELTTQFGFLPTGTQLELKRTGVNTFVNVTRTAASFSVGNAADLNNTFESVRFLLPNNASNGVVVRCARDVRVDDFIDFGGANVLRVTDVTRPGGTIQVLDFADATNISAAAGDRWVVRSLESTSVYPLRFTLGVSRGGAPVETFTSLALDPTHPSYYFKEGTINETATTIRVTERAAGAITENSLPTTTVVSRPGSDVAAQPSNFRSGFTTLEAEPEPAMVICPETTRLEDPLIAADVIGAMVNHCQTFRRLAVVDAPDMAKEQDLVDWRNQTVASTYCSVYAPHVKIVSLDPDAIERFALVPPSGFVTGVMARVDRIPPGVAKAPANEQVTGIVGVSQTFTQRQQELLNPNAVNVIRAFPGRGIRVWGARNATDDVQFRYTNVRRLFNAIETSVERGTQWVVFEPNTASTWLRVKVSVEGFLEQRWRGGELAGATPAEAFRVRVGLGETMTEDQVDLGLVIVEVAIAPAKPAEFVVFRFSHKRLSE